MRKRHLHHYGNLRESYREALTIFETDLGRLLLWVGLVVVFAVIPFLLSTAALHLATEIGIYSIAALGLNILVGFTGKTSLCQGAFFGVGVYTVGILQVKAGWSFWGAVFLSGFTTAALGTLVGLLVLHGGRLTVALATLAGQLIIQSLLNAWAASAGGASGILISHATLFGFNLSSAPTLYIVTFAFLGLTSWITANLIRGRYGRAFIAIRHSEHVAEAIGIASFPYKLLSFALSAFYAGLAGGLFAYYTRRITPEPFTIWLSIEFLAMIVLGGMGSISGSIVGSALIVILDRLMAQAAGLFMQIPVEVGAAPFREIVFGLILVLFILFQPEGLAGIWRTVQTSFRVWPFAA